MPKINNHFQATLKFINEQLSSNLVPENMTLAEKNQKLTEAKAQLEESIKSNNQSIAKFEAEISSAGGGILVETAKVINIFFQF